MNNPGILAAMSLVLNGDFTRSFSEWRKGTNNPEWLSIDEDSYGSGRIKLLAAGNESSVSQEFLVPWASGDDARYVLSFLFESRHHTAGLLRVHVVGKPDLFMDVPLPARPGLQRDLEKTSDTAPLEFVPTVFNVPLELPLEHNERIGVSVLSPANAPNEYQLKIMITRIRLDLHLIPAAVHRLEIDEQIWEQWHPAQTLYLCLGATSSLAHQLRFVVDADNPWSATGASLTIEHNPLDALRATPEWGVDQSLSERWELDCPNLGEEKPYLFTLNLLNRFIADPFPVQVSLGHHRLVFLQTLQPAYFPVLEYGQSVTVGVQVGSYYTRQPISGQTVRWGIKGRSPIHFAQTSADGWVYFEFSPDSAGLLWLQASVDSLYYPSGVVTEDIQVPVLETDPWKDVLAVVEGVASPWQEKTGYPNRGSTYGLILRLPVDSRLLGTEIAMFSQGDSLEQLGVGVEPALGQWLTAGTRDLLWVFACEDRFDGRFSLSLQCSKLKLPSQPKNMSLARNLVRIGDVQEANKHPVVDERESVLLRVQVLHVVTSGDGEPVQRALVFWHTPEGVIRTFSGSGGWASLLYRPMAAGALKVVVEVKAHEEAVAQEHTFDVQALATSPWKNQITLMLDGVQVDLIELGIVCRRGGSHVLKVMPVAGSSLLNQQIALNWRGTAPAIGLTVSNLGTGRTLTAQGLEWTFSSQAGNSISSLFALELSNPVLQTNRELFGRLLSASLADEFVLMLDQVPALAGDDFYPCLGARHVYQILPNTLSPLVGLKVRLIWSGTPAEELRAGVEPPMAVEQTLSDAGFSWILDFASSLASGEFAIHCDFPQLSAAAPSNAMHLDHNKLRIDSYRETAVDPVINQDTAWQWVRVVSAFTGLPVKGAPVDWLAQGRSTQVATDEDGCSSYGLKPTEAGMHSVTARVTSPFDGFAEHRSMSVEAHASDPWQGVWLSFDGQEARPFGEWTCFPRRKGEHLLKISADPDSPLLDRELTLGISGTGPTELGVQVENNGLGVARKFSASGLEYAFKCADLKDGSFEFCLAAERLANLSPGNAMSLGEGSLVMNIENLTHIHQTLDWGEALIAQVWVLASTTGKPMKDVTVTWTHPDLDLGHATSQTDFYGVARIRFTPVTTGAGLLKATVGDELYSASVDLGFTLNEPRKIIELYEPDDSRLSPRDSLAYAKAKVVSAHTYLPVAGVTVYWELSDRVLGTSMTDAEGIASLTFTMTAEDNPVLSATVRGGEAGWDYAQLLYSGVIPVIDSLTSAEVHILLGSTANAVVRVVSRNDRQPLEGIRVRWAFPGLSLPDTTTDREGHSTIQFVPTRPGVNPLSATAGLGAAGVLEFNVAERAELVDMTLSSPVVYTGEPLTANVHMIKGSPKGTLMSWHFAGTVVSSSTAIEGWTSYTHIPRQFPAGGITAFEARIFSGLPTKSSISRKVWVTSTDNAVAKGSILFVNQIPVLLPNWSVPIKIKHGTEIDVGLLLKVDGGLVGHSFSILSTHDEIVFEPGAGVPVRIDDQFTWKMRAQVPVGTVFAIAVSSSSFSGSIGAVFEVVAAGFQLEDVVVPGE